MKTIRDFALKDKKVIIRVDFNVPIENGIIKDDNKIKESLETINYAIKNGSKVILLSHLGRIDTEEDKLINSLKPISERLSELLNKEVIFSSETRGTLLETKITKMHNGDVLLIENTRFEDLNGKLESSNDENLGKYWASLGDIFINDAFATIHRIHASNVGIATHLKSGIGFLMEKELNSFKPVLTNPKHPFILILGGSKVSDKIGLIENLITKVDYILIGGGMAFTFLQASGLNVGSSIVDLDHLNYCQELLKKYKDKIILPIDVITGLDKDKNTIVKEHFISDIESNEKGFDIGNNTLKVFEQYLKDSKLIVWNGPMGVFEIDEFSKGTKKLCDIITKLDAFTIVGGGDTARAVINFGYKDKFSHVSTGGGASLELLEGKVLKALEVLEKQL